VVERVVLVRVLPELLVVPVVVLVSKLALPVVLEQVGRDLLVETVAVVLLGALEVAHRRLAKVVLPIPRTTVVMVLRRQ